MSARLSVRTKVRRPDESLLGHLLAPIDRLSETIYSILIVLTFTLAFSIIRPHTLSQPLSGAYIDGLVVAALGATLAWGLIDGIMYMLMEMLQRGERHRLLEQLQTADTEQQQVAVIADEFDYILEPISSESERASLYSNLATHLQHRQLQPIGLRREDFTGALGCVVVALLAVLPSLVPLVLLREQSFFALRVSNVMSLIMLCINGYFWGTYTGAHRVKTGLLLVAVGVVLVLIAFLFGG